jgi:hypothetical protein
MRRETGEEGRYRGSGAYDTGGVGIADSLTDDSAEVTWRQELLNSDSNARSIGMTKAEKLQRLKGLREGCDSNDVWKSFLMGTPGWTGMNLRRSSSCRA